MSKPKDKDALPLKLSLASVRRVVEVAMGQGYFLAVLDHAMYRGEGREFLSDEVKKIVSYDAALNPSPEIYEPVVVEHLKFALNVNELDMVEMLIRAARSGKRRSGALASANAEMARRGRREKYPIPEEVLTAARARYDAEQARRGGGVEDRTRVTDSWWKELHKEFKEHLGQRSWASFRDRIYKVRSGKQ